jgi:DnaJ-domain-containing protein 1
LIECSNRLNALEEAYRQLWEEHQACPRVPPVVGPPRSGCEDAFAVLGVRADAEPEAIEGAYRALAKKYHPDRSRGDPASEARMKAVTAAYAEVQRRMRARP